MVLGFIVFNDFYLQYTFQFTISSEHDIKPGLLDFLRNFQGLPWAPMHNIYKHPATCLLKLRN